MHVLLVQSFEFLEADIVRFKKKGGGGGFYWTKNKGVGKRQWTHKPVQREGGDITQFW